MTLRKRDLAAAVAGNALEFYDFTAYAFFAIQIGDTFFPVKDEFTRLMLTLVTFGGSFFLRPIGGAVIGRYADRRGRKPAMLLSFGLMGLGVAGLALTPSYAQIGIAAPVIVVLLRLMQGFALGGEVGPTTAFLLEVAPKEKRGLYGSLQFVGQGISTVLAGVAGVALATLLTAQQLQQFGWRIAFLFGVLVVPLGFILRRNLPETLHVTDTPALPTRPTRRLVKNALLGLFSIMGSTTGVYVLNYMSTYAQRTLHMKANISFAATVMFGVSNVVFSLIAGALSDRYGRRPLMIWPRVILLLITWPVFFLISTHVTTFVLLAGTAVLAMFTQGGGAVSLVAITESFPPTLRSTTMAGVYAIAVALFGGTTQPIITWLMQKTGDNLAPGYWLMGTTFMCLIATLFMDETAPVKTGRADP